MKKVFCFLNLLLLFHLSNAQFINMNPDQNGDPWIAGDVPEITPEVEEKLNSIPEMTLSEISSIILLPSIVDNSLNIFMRPIFTQDGGSCGQASGVGYTFTYEINRLRNLSSTSYVNQYPTHFTFNFINTGYGSFPWDGWDIIKEIGCPKVTTWGGMAGDELRWMTGYENYYLSTFNKIAGYNYIFIGSEWGLITLKHWINDHNAGSNTGGLACFQTDMSGIIIDEIPPGSISEAGKSIISDFQYPYMSASHSMTFVGYNDNVMFDINNDDLFTNDEDTNEDGIINMLDWEIGALKIANSWGQTWPFQDDEGFIYFPYRLLPKTVYNPNNPEEYMDAIMDKKVHVIDAIEINNPSLIIKTNLQYPCRENLKIKVGYGNSANTNHPIENREYHSFNNQGGCVPMQGINTEPIEVGLDFGYWFSNIDFGKIFFIVYENDENNYSSGTIQYFSIIDYRWDEEFELFCNEANVSINNNSSTILSINYDLIPHETAIITNLTLSSDMVSRFTPTIALGATLTVEDGVNIDMYNSEIHIEMLSSLILEDNVTITAKKGVCKIIVNGNVSIGSNVNFLAEEGAEIRLEINNTSLMSTINSAYFQRGLLQSNQNSLTLNNCYFDISGGVVFSLGNLTASGCHFDGASLHATNGSTGKWVTITNQCQFTNAGYGVYLLSYPNFSIQHSTFISNSTGIGLYQSGTGGGRQLLNNTITSNGTGILVYNSLATLTSKNMVNKGNRIYNNYVGLQSYNNSQVSLIGYAMATSWNATQYITDNAHYEVYATQGSFPVPFRNNAVFDEDNTEPMLYYTGQLSESLDVRNNYWGVNFNSQSDFYPWQIYNYIPVWIPGGGGGGSGAGAEALYLAARENIETEEYAEAKEGLEQIVDEYPETEFAKAAMKELYAIEEYSGDNYTALKDYFNSNSVIQGDSSLIKLADFLANFCEIKLENWPTAIAWFEDVVENPETMEDSIFAIIDMGYTYWLMENGGLKSTYTGTMPQYKFASQKDYEENRDYLLSLLPGDGLSETIKQSLSTLKSGKLLQNVPNPFNGTTQIWFKLAEESSVSITIYDYTGKEVSVINPGTLKTGNHSVEFNSANHSSGIYFYALEVNSIKTDMKKMTIIR